MVFPRATTWYELLKRTNTPGIHFEDHPELQGYESPEWSHLSASEANRFTAALMPIVQREVEAQESKSLPAIRRRPLAGDEQSGLQDIYVADVFVTKRCRVGQAYFTMRTSTPVYCFQKPPVL